MPWVWGEPSREGHWVVVVVVVVCFCHCCGGAGWRCGAVCVPLCSDLPRTVDALIDFAVDAGWRCIYICAACPSELVSWILAARMLWTGRGVGQDRTRPAGCGRCCWVVVLLLFGAVLRGFCEGEEKEQQSTRFLFGAPYYTHTHTGKHTSELCGSTFHDELPGSWFSLAPYYCICCCKGTNCGWVLLLCAGLPVYSVPPAWLSPEYNSSSGSR